MPALQNSRLLDRTLLHQSIDSIVIIVTHGKNPAKLSATLSTEYDFFAHQKMVFHEIVYVINQVIHSSTAWQFLHKIQNGLSEIFRKAL